MSTELFLVCTDESKHDPDVDDDADEFEHVDVQRIRVGRVGDGFSRCVDLPHRKTVVK
jgi:hypothetical protein